MRELYSGPEVVGRLADTERYTEASTIMQVMLVCRIRLYLSSVVM